MLTIKNLSVSFTSDDKKVAVINDISFNIFKNKILGMFGES